MDNGIVFESISLIQVLNTNNQDLFGCGSGHVSADFQ